MPGEAGIREADMLVCLVADVGDQQDLGVIRQQVFLDDMDFQLAEAAAECDVRLVGQVLVAEYDDDIVVERVFDRLEGRARSISRERSKTISAPSGAFAWMTCRVMPASPFGCLRNLRRRPWDCLLASGT